MIRRRRGLVNQIVTESKKGIEIKNEYSRDELISTGSTLLNLALSDSPDGGFSMGKMVNIVGDSNSGKTLLALSICAEMAKHKRFDKHRFIFDDVEAANEFDLSKMFGVSVASRIEPPSVDEEGGSKYSDTIQDFQVNISRALSNKVPFIWILDSFDAMTSEEEKGRIQDKLKGKDVGGTYGMNKPKIIGETLRMIIRDLKKTASLLIIISQTRDNINPMSFEKKTRSGGRALKFYATHEMWLAVGEKFKSRDRIIGVESKVKITKNKLTGKVRQVSFPVYYDYGIDDIGSCIDFMVEEKFWHMNKQTIDAVDLELKGTRQYLINQIEKNNLESELKKVMAFSWTSIEDSLKLKRKPKYL